MIAEQFGPAKLAFILAMLLVAALIAVGGVVFYRYHQRMTGAGIKDYKTCAAAGNPVLLTYPGQCVAPDGHRYIQDH